MTRETGKWTERLGLPLAVVPVLLLFPVCLHAGALFKGEVPHFMDIVTLFYPLKEWAAHLLAEGTLPFWNRCAFAGVPLLANPQAGLLYPGHWPFFLWPCARIFTLINVVHIALFGLGVASWCAIAFRRVGGERPVAVGAVVAGLLAQVGGWTWAHLAFGAFLQVAAWAPWMFWAFERVVRAMSMRSAVRWAVVGGCFGAMQWLAGAPQLAVYCQAGLGAFILCRCVLPGEYKRMLALGLIFMTLVAVIALGLSAPQWMTTRAFVAECERASDLPFERVESGALSAIEIVDSWKGGDFLPENAEQILYPGLLGMGVGALGVFLALWGCCARRKEEAPCSLGNLRRIVGILPLVLSSVLIVALSVVLAWRGAARFFYDNLPLYAGFHDPKRILFLAYLFTLFLTGLGMQYLWESRRRAVFHWFIAGIMLLAVVEPIVFAYRRIDIEMTPSSHFIDAKAVDGLESSRDGEPVRFFAYDTGIQYSYNFRREGFARTLLPNLSMFYGLEDVQGFDPLIPWRYALYMRRLNQYPAPTPTLYPSHFGLVRNADSPWLSRFGAMMARGQLDCLWPFLPPTLLLPEQGSGNSSSSRSRFSINLAQEGRVWEMDRTRLENVRVFMGYVAEDGVAPSDVLELQFEQAGEVVATAEFEPLSKADLSSISMQAGAGFHSGVMMPAHRARIRPGIKMKSLGQDVPFFHIDRIVVRSAGGGTAIEVYGVGLPRPAELFEATGVADTFRSKWSETFPQRVVFSPYQANHLEDREAYEDFAMRYRPDVVQVEVGEATNVASVPSRVIRGWTWEICEANRLKIKLPEGHEGGWLVLGEPLMRGWKCSVDGEPSHIYCADTLFRAVAVPRGGHVVEMNYWPPGFTAGLLLFIATALLGVVLLCWLDRKRLG